MKKAAAVTCISSHYSDKQETTKQDIIKLACKHHKIYAGFDVPFGCANSPFSTPDLIALLNWVSKTASEEARFLWLALRYFLSEGRLRATIE